MEEKILLIQTGGTIASSQSSEGIKPIFKGKKLIEQMKLREKNFDYSNLEIMELFNIDSTNINPEHWRKIVETIECNYEKYKGFIISHGTDTMAYTSSALTYMIQNLTKPIIITGSQNTLSDNNTDAVKNMTDSIRFANKKIPGVFVVFDGKVINGARVEKIRTRSWNAFESINYPYEAIINKDRVLYNRELVEKVLDSKEIRFNKNIFSDIFLLKLTPFTDEKVFDYIETNYKCLVIESYGIGGIPFKGKKILGKLKSMIDKGIIVVATTQVLFEGSNFTQYEVGKKALSCNIIPAYDMNTQAIMTKLMWLMGEHDSFNKIKEEFLKPVNNDINNFSN